MTASVVVAPSDARAEIVGPFILHGTMTPLWDDPTNCALDAEATSDPERFASTEYLLVESSRGVYAIIPTPRVGNPVVFDSRVDVFYGSSLVEGLDPPGSPLRSLFDSRYTVTITPLDVDFNGWTHSVEVTNTCRTWDVLPLALNLPKRPIAGAPVPIFFRVKDATGRWARSLPAADVMRVQHPCGTPQQRLPLNTPRHTLTSIHHGTYLAMLPTSRAWAGTCMTLGVNVAGNTRTVDIQFR